MARITFEFEAEPFKEPVNELREELEKLKIPAEVRSPAPGLVVVEAPEEESEEVLYVARKLGLELTRIYIHRTLKERVWKRMDAVYAATESIQWTLDELEYAVMRLASRLSAEEYAGIREKIGELRGALEKLERRVGELERVLDEVLG